MDRVHFVQRFKVYEGSRSFRPMSCSPRVVSPGLRVDSPREWSHFARGLRTGEKGVWIFLVFKKGTTNISISVNSWSGRNDFILVEQRVVALKSQLEPLSNALKRWTTQLEPLSNALIMKSKALRRPDNYQTTKHNEWSTLCNTKATRWSFVATQNAQSVELSYAWFLQIGSQLWFPQNYFSTNYGVTLAEFHL